MEVEYAGRVRLRMRPFPLELLRPPAAPRALLAEEWWLAAVQEPAAEFSAFTGDDWPATTLPAFAVVRAVAEQDERLASALDMRVRRAFFAEGRNIGRESVLLDLVRELGGDVAHVTRALASGEVLEAVKRDARLGRERYGVRGTPTLMLADGARLEIPLATPRVSGGRIVGVRAQTCLGETCRAATRALFERAIHDAAPAGAHPGAAT